MQGARKFLQAAENIHLPKTRSELKKKKLIAYSLNIIVYNWNIK
jgi:hypothetical protein